MTRKSYHFTARYFTALVTVDKTYDRHARIWWLTLHVQSASGLPYDARELPTQQRDAGGRWDPWRRRWVLPERPDFCECDEVTTDALQFEEYGEFVRYTVVRWKYEET